MYLTLVVVAVVVSQSQSGSEVEVVLSSDCDEYKSWTWDSGGEFPGALGGVSGCGPQDQNETITLEYNFKEGGRYVGASYVARWLKTELPATLPLALRLHLHPRPGETSACGNSNINMEPIPFEGGVKIVDKTGQVFSTSLPTPNHDGDILTDLSLNNSTFKTHYGGMNDGIIHLPILGVVITASIVEAYKCGAVNIHKASFIYDEKTLPTLMSFTGSAEVTSEGVQIGVTSRITTTNTTDQLTLQCKTFGITTEYLAPGSTEATNRTVLSPEVVPIVLKGYEKYERLLPVSIITQNRSGYFPVLVTVECNNTRQTTETAVLTRVTIPAIEALKNTQNTEAYRFGSQSVPLGQEQYAFEQIGIKSVRYAIGWRWAQKNASMFAWGQYRNSAARIKQGGFTVLLQAIFTPPNWVQNQTYPRIPTRANFSQYGEFVAAAVSWLQEQNITVIGVEVDNEPDNDLVYQSKIPFDEAVNIYGSLASEADKGLKRHSINVPLGGADVSGGDFRNNLSFAAAVLDDKSFGSLFSFFSGHPYIKEPSRYIGEHSEWLLPTTLLRQKLSLAESTIANSRMPSGNLGFTPSEFGYALSPNASSISYLNQIFGAVTAQSLIVMASSNSPRFYNFASQFLGLENGYSYGLWRFPNSVKTDTFQASGGGSHGLAALSAFATAAYFLDTPTSFVNARNLSGNITVLNFQTTNKSNGNTLLTRVVFATDKIHANSCGTSCIPQNELVGVWDGLGNEVRAPRNEIQPSIMPLYIVMQV
eukprot:m.202721 g.202721  ORF g.202721 m.202721 type:complete len:762 (+) comp15752_c1_seq10:54-2339(+)